MALVSSADVQAWLEPTKLRLDSDDDLVEEIHASAIVMAQLSTRFDTSAWVDSTTTPQLVRTIISMLVAAYRYNSLYSETINEERETYGDKLEEKAMLLLQQVVDGQLIIEEALDGPAVTGTLEFYPTDASTLIDDEEDAGRKFTMGQRF